MQKGIVAKLDTSPAAKKAVSATTLFLPKIVGKQNKETRPLIGALSLCGEMARHLLGARTLPPVCGAGAALVLGDFFGCSEGREASSPETGATHLLAPRLGGVKKRSSSRPQELEYRTRKRS